MNLDNQVDYWNRIGPGKPFAHPLNFDRLAQWLTPESRIADVGCGYGRALGLLLERGYHNLVGFDPAPAMIAMARERFPAIAFEVLNDPPHIPLPDASVDATLLFSVLTCVPRDEGQRAVVAEVRRILRPGGLFYISDLWRSLEGEVTNAGSVHFDQAPGERGTQVKVVLNYNAPGGKVSAMLAKLFGQEPGQMIEADLLRLKQVMEGGEVAITEGQAPAHAERKSSTTPEVSRAASA